MPFSKPGFIRQVRNAIIALKITVCDFGFEQKRMLITDAAAKR